MRHTRAMGLRERVMRWLARGEVGTVDPSAEVEVEVAEVMLHEGPMLVSALQRAGVPARGVETWNLAAKTTNRMRILVSGSDEAKAMAVIRESNVVPRRNLC
jgi:hypothetical protein